MSLVSNNNTPSASCDLAHASAQNQTKAPSFSSLRRYRAIFAHPKNYIRFAEIFIRTRLGNGAQAVARITKSQRMQHFSRVQAFKVSHIQSKIQITWGRFILRDQLVETSRNIAHVKVVDRKEDVETAQELWSKIGHRDSKETLVFEGMMTDGVCFGASLEFIRKYHQNKSAVDAAKPYREGVDAHAAANQVVYENDLKVAGNPGVGYTLHQLEQIFLGLTSDDSLKDALSGLTKADVRAVFDHLKDEGMNRVYPDRHQYHRAISNIETKDGYLERMNDFKIAPSDPGKSAKTALIKALSQFLTQPENEKPNSPWIDRVADPEFKKAFEMAAYLAKNTGPKEKVIQRGSMEGEENFASLHVPSQLGESLYQYVRPYNFYNSSREQIKDISEKLPSGSYLLAISTGTGSHQIALVKGTGDEKSYLFDPEFGLIDCQGDVEKTLLKLLSLYPKSNKKKGSQPNGEDLNYKCVLLPVEPKAQSASASN
ncbi:MAG: hypothetical protein K0S07_365 [Chlamydiales bacterium]|jgi:hypothetical protein|nr:hypothetical protein [Chlamydiales bacterium]